MTELLFASRMIPLSLVVEECGDMYELVGGMSAARAAHPYIEYTGVGFPTAPPDRWLVGTLEGQNSTLR